MKNVEGGEKKQMGERWRRRSKCGTTPHMWILQSCRLRLNRGRARGEVKQIDARILAPHCVGTRSAASQHETGFQNEVRKVLAGYTKGDKLLTTRYTINKCVDQPFLFAEGDGKIRLISALPPLHLPAGVRTLSRCHKALCNLLIRGDHDLRDA